MRDEGLWLHDIGTVRGGRNNHQVGYQYLAELCDEGVPPPAPPSLVLQRRAGAVGTDDYRTRGHAECSRWSMTIVERYFGADVPRNWLEGEGIRVIETAIWGEVRQKMQKSTWVYGRRRDGAESLKVNPRGRACDCPRTESQNCCR